MIEINLTTVHWLEGSDANRDLCAHGSVAVTVHGTKIDSGDPCCVSAAALFLMRTLTQNHSEQKPVCDALLPHCGHTMIDQGHDDVTIVECPNGFNWDVFHEGSITRLIFKNHKPFDVDRRQWESAVFGFADQVEGFYASAEPKRFSDDYDEKGYRKFWSEWHRRRKHH